MIKLEDDIVKLDMIHAVREENGMYYLYTTDFIKYCISKEEYERLVNNK